MGSRPGQQASEPRTHPAELRCGALPRMYARPPPGGPAEPPRHLAGWGAQREKRTPLSGPMLLGRPLSLPFAFH